MVSFFVLSLVLFLENQIRYLAWVKEYMVIML